MAICKGQQHRAIVLLLIVVSFCPASMGAELRIEPANGLEAGFTHRHELLLTRIRSSVAKPLCGWPVRQMGELYHGRHSPARRGLRLLPSVNHIYTVL
jgi:hypothetical protein